MKSVPPYHLPSQRLFEVDWAALSELELLALLLGPGSQESRALCDAQRLLETVGCLQRLKEASYSELCSGGLSKKKALAVLAAIQLWRRATAIPLVSGQSFRSSLDIFRHFQTVVEGLKKECFWNILLDGKNRMLRVGRISEGSLTSSLVHPREVYRPAIREAAAGVVFVHNHPSGDPTPSREDVEITERLVKSGQLVGIRALDHVIMGTDQYFSFADQGLLLNRSHGGHP